MKDDSTAGGSEPRLEVTRQGDRLLLTCSGAWQTRRLGGIERTLARLAPPADCRRATLELSGIDQLDTAGAWLLHRTQKGLTAAGLRVELAGTDAKDQRLLETITANDRPPPPKPPRVPAVLAFVNKVGETLFGVAANSRDLINFLGHTIIVLGYSLARPWRIRWRAVVAHMETSGVTALLIVGLISFLIGIVLAYQGAAQLERFGAQIFTVNIVGIGVLREMAILLTAIIVAGRSGSAYTAQIGAMQVNEEVDALKTLGLDPMEILVVPRIIALSLVLPLLAFYADIMGLLGGAMMASAALDISIGQFITQLRTAVTGNDLFVGLVKAPVFAFIIATVGCFEGFRVERSAESVGHATTRSVVESIFLVIVLDATLSIFFQVVGI